MKRTHPHTDVHSIKLGTDVSTGLVAHSKQHARNQSKTHTVDHKIRWKQELTQKACTKKPGHRKHTHSASVWWNFLFLKSPNRHNRLSRLFSSRFGYLTCTPVSLHLAKRCLFTRPSKVLSQNLVTPPKLCTTRTDMHPNLQCYTKTQELQMPAGGYSSAFICCT
jgi:hypothetical protein